MRKTTKPNYEDIDKTTLNALLKDYERKYKIFQVTRSLYSRTLNAYVIEFRSEINPQNKRVFSILPNRNYHDTHKSIRRTFNNEELELIDKS